MVVVMEEEEGGISQRRPVRLDAAQLNITARTHMRFFLPDRHRVGGQSGGRRGRQSAQHRAARKNCPQLSQRQKTSRAADARTRRGSLR